MIRLSRFIGQPVRNSRTGCLSRYLRSAFRRSAIALANSLACHFVVLLRVDQHEMDLQYHHEHELPSTRINFVNNNSRSNSSNKQMHNNKHSSSSNNKPTFQE